MYTTNTVPEQQRKRICMDAPCKAVCAAGIRLKTTIYISIYHLFMIGVEEFASSPHVLTADVKFVKQFMHLPHQLARCFLLHFVRNTLCITVRPFLFES